MNIKELLSEIRFLKGEKVLRRYFVMNSFDGILTTIGILLGSFISNSIVPGLIIRVVLATGIAMLVSGFFGTLMTEFSERKREIKTLEKAMIKKFRNSILQKSAIKISIISALVDGSSPLLASLLSIIPFFFSFPPLTSFYISLGISTIFLFVIGVYLSKISEENLLIGGIKMLSIGVLVTFLILLLKPVGV
ncbi:MAG: VIT1/CCC1 transporter family protein [Candidatus Aenigmarchaeota archaeon]|nr:VIT1/CCC1 transporter family protein [Candidatus Aenigmarchaeota archaeon]